MKNNKGVTLIILAITIIILLILATIGTSGGISVYRKSVEKKQLSEVKMVQQAVLEAYTKYRTTKNERYLIGTQLEYQEAKELSEGIVDNLKVTSEEYTDKDENIIKLTAYYQLSKANLENMGISSTEDIYVVNYKTGEVFNSTLKTTKSGEPLYVYAVDN